MFLIAVDAHSKWPEVIPMASTTSAKTLATLRTIFARNGLPDQVCTDNGPQFVSEDFKAFLQNNGVRHFTSAPYHPATNGLEERFVQTFKRGIKAMKDDPPKLQNKVDCLLFAYRNAPHATMGQPPAVLMFSRRLRSKIDLLKPDVRREVEDKQYQKVYDAPAKPTRQFLEGHHVMSRDYRPRHKWQPATVCGRQRPLTYKVKVGESLIHRYTDQLVGRHAPTESTTTPDTLNAYVQTECDTPTMEDIREEFLEDEDVTDPVRSEEAPCESSPVDEPPPAARRYPATVRRPPERFNL